MQIPRSLGHPLHKHPDSDFQADPDSDAQASGLRQERRRVSFTTIGLFRIAEVVVASFSMRKIRELLCLEFECGLSTCKITHS